MKNMDAPKFASGGPYASAKKSPTKESQLRTVVTIEVLLMAMNSWCIALYLLGFVVELSRCFSHLQSHSETCKRLRIVLLCLLAHGITVAVTFPLLLMTMFVEGKCTLDKNFQPFIFSCDSVIQFKPY